VLYLCQIFIFWENSTVTWRQSQPENMANQKRHWNLLFFYSNFGRFLVPYFGCISCDIGIRFKIWHSNFIYLRIKHILRKKFIGSDSN
jgi:hypothetical protein